MKDDFDDYLDKVEEELARRAGKLHDDLYCLERQERLYRRIRYIGKCVLWFLAGTGVYHYFELIWRICTR